jgi:hypothetical protein
MGLWCAIVTRLTSLVSNWVEFTDQFFLALYAVVFARDSFCKEVCDARDRWILVMLKHACSQVVCLSDIQADKMVRAER